MEALPIVLTLLHVFQATGDNVPHQRAISHIARNRQDLVSEENSHVTSLMLMNPNQLMKGTQDHYTSSLRKRSSRINRKGSDYYSRGDTYCKVISENEHHISDLIKLFQHPPSLRTSNAVLLCERNCTEMAAKLCNSNCIPATLEILAYSCIRKCQLSEGEREYLHDYDIHPGPEYMCKKKHEEHARCCKNNCLRSIYKHCWVDKVRVCTVETVKVLNTSCVSKCERGSDNPYLNAFCSFMFKYKKKRKKGTTYFWDNITPNP